MTKRISGFYTREAAMVLLISLFSIFSLVSLGFYLHDIQSIQAEMNWLTDLASTESWNQEELLWEGEGRISAEALGLLSLEVLQVEVREEAGVQTLVVETKYGMLKSEVKIHSPEDFARKTEAVKESIE